MAYTYNGAFFDFKNEILAHATTWIIKPDPKDKYMIPLTGEI